MHKPVNCVVFTVSLSRLINRSGLAVKRWMQGECLFVNFLTRVSVAVSAMFDCDMVVLQ